MSQHIDVCVCAALTYYPPLHPSVRITVVGPSVCLSSLSTHLQGIQILYHGCCRCYCGVSYMLMAVSLVTASVTHSLEAVMVHVFGDKMNVIMLFSLIDNL